MTIQPSSAPNAQPTPPVTADVERAGGRPFTEPLRETAALALLAGNAVFLFLGFTSLFFVLDGWAAEFGARSAATFPVFVGPLSLGLPIVAVLLATHVLPVVPRHRVILLAAGIEYGVSAVFGLATFLGAFADDLPAARVALEGLLYRAVWLGFLILGALVLARLYVGLVPGPALVLGGTPLRRRSDLIPGQGNVYRSGTADPAIGGGAANGEGEPSFDGPTADTGWPVVPPPPRPEPLVAPTDATIRMPSPPTTTASPDAAPVETDAPPVEPAEATDNSEPDAAPDAGPDVGPDIAPEEPTRILRRTPPSGTDAGVS